MQNNQDNGKDDSAIKQPEMGTEEKAFWLSKTVEERLAALEQMRQEKYGYDPETARMEKVIEIVDIGELDSKSNK